MFRKTFHAPVFTRNPDEYYVWWKKSHTTLVEMFGEHDKIGFPKCFDHKDVEIVESYGFTKPDHMAIGRLGHTKNEWYHAYYVFMMDRNTADLYHEFVYHFNSEVYSVQFKLAMS